MRLNLLLLLFTATWLYSQETSQTTQSPQNDFDYCFFFLYGSNTMIIDENPAGEVYSFIMHPPSYKKHLGLNIHHSRFKEMGRDYYETWLMFQPYFKFQSHYLYFKSGFDVVFINSEEPETIPFVIFPLLDIGIGNFHKFYLNATFISDIIYGLGSINLNYLFNDKISGIAIGRGYEEQIITWRVDCKVWQRLVIRSWGEYQFIFDEFSLQSGIGLIF